MAARLAFGVLALLCAAAAPAQAATAVAATSAFEMSATEASQGGAMGEAGVSRADRLDDLDASTIDADRAALARPSVARASGGFAGGNALLGRPAGAPQKRPPRVSS